MQLWVHTADVATGNKVGLLDVRPTGAALSLIDDNKAQDPRIGGHNLKKSVGHVGWKGHQAIVVDSTFQPVFTENPTVSGAVAVGSLLTCNPGKWTANPSATPAYQWRQGTTPIAAANAATYTTVAGDVGLHINCQVTITNTQGNDVAVSDNFIVPV